MSPVSLLLNVLWIIFGGAEMAVAWGIATVIMAITIVGLPWARAALNIALYTLLPFGHRAVSRAEYTGHTDLGTGAFSRRVPFQRLEQPEPIPRKVDLPGLQHPSKRHFILGKILEIDEVLSNVLLLPHPPRRRLVTLRERLTGERDALQARLDELNSLLEKLNAQPSVADLVDEVFKVVR